MPDLTIEIHAMCAQLENHYRKIKDYDLEYTGYEGWGCSCPGFKYRHDCKHVKQAREEQCTWHGAYDEPQEQEGVCPRCGGPTVYVKVGV